MNSHREIQTQTKKKRDGEKKCSMVTDLVVGVVVIGFGNAYAAWSNMHQAQNHWQTMSAALVANHVHLHQSVLVAVAAVAAAVVEPNMKGNIVP